MGMLARLIGMLSKHGSLPVVALLAGWYGGAKIGAPDFVMNSIDGVLNKGGELIGSALPGGDEDSAEEEGVSNGGGG